MNYTPEEIEAGKRCFAAYNKHAAFIYLRFPPWEEQRDEFKKCFIEAAKACQPQGEVSVHHTCQVFRHEGTPIAGWEDWFDYDFYLTTNEVMPRFDAEKGREPDKKLRLVKRVTYETVVSS